MDVPIIATNMARCQMRGSWWGRGSRPQSSELEGRLEGQDEATKLTIDDPSKGLFKNIYQHESYTLLVLVHCVGAQLID